MAERRIFSSQYENISRIKTPVEPKTIERSVGKAKRIIDKRKK